MAIILILITAVVGASVYFGVMLPKERAYKAAQNKITGILLPTPKEIKSFKFTDNQGRSFTKKNLEGKWTMMFFGFTNCGLVCPTSLASLNEMYKILQAELQPNQLPQVVFVSVDPERDTVKRLNDYVKAFNPHFTGARGSDSETAALTQQLHIAAAKMQVKGGKKDNYFINHSAEILVINPNAQVVAYLTYPHKPESLVKDYKILLNAGVKHANP